MTDQKPMMPDELRAWANDEDENARACQDSLYVMAERNVALRKRADAAEAREKRLREALAMLRFPRPGERVYIGSARRKFTIILTDEQAAAVNAALADRPEPEANPREAVVKGCRWPDCACSMGAWERCNLDAGGTDNG